MRLAAVRVRSGHDMTPTARRALELLRLYNTHSCVVLANTATIRGMLVATKDYITYGPIDIETEKLLLTKRGEEYKGNIEKKGRFIVFEGKKYKKTFRLSPPKGGFERKGIKWPYSRGGVLGQRKEMATLIKKMI